MFFSDSNLLGPLSLMFRCPWLDPCIGAFLNPAEVPCQLPISMAMHRRVFTSTKGL